MTIEEFKRVLRGVSSRDEQTIRRFLTQEREKARIEGIREGWEAANKVAEFGDWFYTDADDYIATRRE